MSDGPKKTLIPEVLPTPAISHPRMRSPRERVQAHMHTLMRYSAVAGAAFLVNCGNCYGDPIPPPAACANARTLGANGTARYEAGKVSVTLEFQVADVWLRDSLAPTPGEPINLQGATLVGYRDTGSPAESLTRIQIDLRAIDGASQITFDVPLSCTDVNGTASAMHAHVVITPAADGGFTVDGGADADAGNASDAGDLMDAGATPDAGDAADAGNLMDAGPGADAGDTAEDAGTDAGFSDAGLSSGELSVSVELVEDAP